MYCKNNTKKRMCSRRESQKATKYLKEKKHFTHVHSMHSHVENEKIDDFNGVRAQPL